MKTKNIPRSIAIIPDGNRRFAKKLMLQPWKGHEWGAEKLEKVFGWCKEAGIKDITFYTLSLENMESRPKLELDQIFNIARVWLKKVNTDPDYFVHKNKVKLHFFGELNKVPKDIQQNIAKATEKTKSYSGYRINLAVAYGGRQEILNACRSMVAGASSPKSITEGLLRRNLQTNGSIDPDLIIRTGGEKRLSNFLLFQSAYSELSFLEPFWPDLTKEQFIAAIDEFSNRKRRFGK